MRQRYLELFSNSNISLQLHLEGSNETSEENQDKTGQEDFFASEEQFSSNSNILEEPAAALVKPKSPRDPVKNGDDGLAPDVSMVISGEVSKCFLLSCKNGVVLWIHVVWYYDIGLSCNQNNFDQNICCLFLKLN